MGTWGSSTDRGRLSIGKAERLTGALARSRRTPFGPSALTWGVTITDAGGTPETLTGAAGSTGTEYLTDFAGYIAGISIIAASNYAVGGGGQHVTFVPAINDVAQGDAASGSGVAARVVGGGRTSYDIVIGKTAALFAAGDRITVVATKSGTPLGAGIAHTIVVWVAFA